MKKIIIILILIPFVCLSQKTGNKKPIENSKKENTKYETILSKKDFVIDSITINKIKSIYLKDNSDKIVSVKFMFMSTLVSFEKLGLANISLMLSLSNIKTKVRIKNKYTYQPREITLTFNDENKQWTCAVKYSAQNDYGALKNGIIFHTYNEKGEFINTLSE